MTIIILVLCLAACMVALFIYNYRKNKKNTNIISHSDTIVNPYIKTDYAKKEKIQPHVSGSAVKGKPVESNTTLHAQSDSTSSATDLLILSTVLSNDSTPANSNHSGHGGEFGGGGSSGSFDSGSGSQSSCSSASSCSSSSSCSSGSSCGGGGGD